MEMQLATVMIIKYRSKAYTQGGSWSWSECLATYSLHEDIRAVFGLTCLNKKWRNTCSFLGKLGIWYIGSCESNHGRYVSHYLLLMTNMRAHYIIITQLQPNPLSHLTLHYVNSKHSKPSKQIRHTAPSKRSDIAPPLLILEPSREPQNAN